MSQTAPLPANEEARLEALRRLEILDTDAESAFDDVVLLAAQICRTPIATVTLVDEHRQWFKARTGLPNQEGPREHSFCAHAILTPSEVMVVHDATRDDRFADNPLVLGDPYIRFYAGASLVTVEGEALGTICAIDRTPRELAADQIESLQTLARLVMKLFELRRTSGQLAEASERLRHLSETDGLTGLLNRMVFERRLLEEIAYARRHGEPLAVILLDLDHFKALNDSAGHAAGDEALRRVAEALRGQARQSDVVTRYGGEEFAILLRHTDLEGARVLAERFRAAIAEMSLPGTARAFSASLGVAVLAPEMAGGDPLLAAADRALYRAKAAGRNQVCADAA